MHTNHKYQWLDIDHIRTQLISNFIAECCYFTVKCLLTVVEVSIYTNDIGCTGHLHYKYKVRVPLQHCR